MQSIDDAMWAMINMVALVDVITSPATIQAIDGFTLHLSQLLVDRCPKCGYKWTQPKAFLSGEEC